MGAAAVIIGGKILETGIQVAQGINQKNKAKKLKRSEYIPPELLKSMREDEMRASINQTKRQTNADRKIKAASANAAGNITRAGGSAADITMGLAAVNNSTQNAILDSEVMAEGERDNYRQQAKQSRLQVGRLRQKNQDEYEASVSALRGASDQNFFNAATNVASTASFIAGMKGGMVDGKYTPPPSNAKSILPDQQTDISGSLNPQNPYTWANIPNSGIAIPRSQIGQEVDIMDYLGK